MVKIKKICKIIRKCTFLLILNSKQRNKFIEKRKKLFHGLGSNIHFETKFFPDEPELIDIGNNVKIAAGVRFITHDIIDGVINDKTHDYIGHYRGCIQIGDNVAIGANVIILPNVKIGSDVIIGAGAVCSKDIPDNSVAVGNPIKIISSFEALEKKRRLQDRINYSDSSILWEMFKNKK